MRRPYAKRRLSTRAKKQFMGIDYFAAKPRNDSVSRRFALRSCHHPRGPRAGVHDSLLRDREIGPPPATLADGVTITELDPEAAPDDLFHDLGRAAVDGLHPCVEIGTRDRVFAHVAVTAVQLQAPIDQVDLL